MRRYTCESVLRNRRITRLPETIIRGCRNYEQYLSFQPRNYLPMCVRLQRITENSKYCAISSRVLRESISTREGKSSIRRVSHSTSALRREFSTVVRRFPYSVRKGRRPASNGRVAFPCSRCSMRAQMYRTHFALKRFLCFRISSNTFSKRKCLYFGGRNVKRVSRSSFNFFYVPLVKKKKKRKERERKAKKHFPLPRAYRILKISKQHENARPRLPPSLRSEENESREIRGEQSIRQIFGSTAHSDRTNARGNIQKRSKRVAIRKSFGNWRSTLDAFPLRDDYAATFHPRDTSLRLCTGAIYAAFTHTLSLSLLSSRDIRDIRLPREYARHMDPHAPAHRLCKRCAPCYRLLFRDQPCILAYATF